MLDVNKESVLELSLIHILIERQKPFQRVTADNGLAPNFEDGQLSPFHQLPHGVPADTRTSVSYTHLILPAEKEQPIGLWGQRHLRYLKEHRRNTYTTLLTSGRLNTYLADIDKQAQERMERLTEQMKRAQGITCLLYTSRCI